MTETLVQTTFLSSDAKISGSAMVCAQFPVRPLLDIAVTAVSKRKLLRSIGGVTLAKDDSGTG